MGHVFMTSNQPANNFQDITLKGVHKFRNFEEAAASILNLMSQFIGINTLFIAKNDKKTNQIVKVLNRDDILLEENSSLPFDETLCKLSVDYGNEPIIIENISQDELSRDLNVAQSLQGGTFIGIPIYLDNGENYGTICGLDKNAFDVSEKHVELFNVMSSLLTYVLELESANNQIDHLSSPIVPVTEGVAILPIIGQITDSRAETIIHSVLEKIQHLELNYMVIDFSGILSIDNIVNSHLLRLVKLLNLVGVTPIITGMRPDLAKIAVEENVHFADTLITSNLETALANIGFTLQKSK